MLNESIKYLIHGRDHDHDHVLLGGLEDDEVLHAIFLSLIHDDDLSLGFNYQETKEMSSLSMINSLS